MSLRCKRRKGEGDYVKQLYENDQPKMCPRTEYTRLNPAVFAKAVLHWRESCSTLWWSLCLVKSIICVVSLVPFSTSPKDHRAQQSGKLCIQYRLCAWFTAPATFLDAPTSSYIVRMRTADQPTIDTTFSLFFTVASDARCLHFIFTVISRLNISVRVQSTCLALLLKVLLQVQMAARLLQEFRIWLLPLRLQTRLKRQRRHRLKRTLWCRTVHV